MHWTWSALTLGWATACPLSRAPHPTCEPPPTGCGTRHRPGFNNSTANHSIESGGYTRTYAVNVPAHYNDDPHKKWPMIIDYHGNGGTPWQQYEDSQYDKHAGGREYLVVYPQGYNGSWQGASYAVAGVDDLQFTRELVGHLRGRYCVDEARVYASGKSNGGGLVDALACSDHGDGFAAFALAAAALYADTSEAACAKRRAILDAHGDRDATIPYHPTGRGRGGPLPDIAQWVSWWGRRTCGRDAVPVRSGDLGGYDTTWYSCGDYGHVVSHYRIFELGHCWPSATGSNYDASDRYDQTTRKCLDKALDYTAVVVDFFGKWDLQSAPKN